MKLNPTKPIGYEDDYHQQVYGWLNEGDAFQIKSRLLREVMFPMISPNSHVLEYGVGSGVNLAALSCSRKAAFDISEYSRERCRTLGFEVFDAPDNIPEKCFDFVISSHCLEHVSEPRQLLCSLKCFLRPSGKLILVLPIEKHYAEFDKSQMDVHQHLYSWSFRTIANLLISCGYTVESMKYLTTGYTAYRWVRPISLLAYQCLMSVDSMFRPLHRRHMRILATANDEG